MKPKKLICKINVHVYRLYQKKKSSYISVVNKLKQNGNFQLFEDTRMSIEFTISSNNW